MKFVDQLLGKGDSEPSDSDDGPISKSERPRKQKKKGKKPLEDAMSADDDLPGEASDPTQAGYPDQNPEDGPRLKDRRKPRKQSRPSKHDSDSENVTSHELFIIARTVPILIIATSECHCARKIHH